jgi:hypothetical protein
MTPFGRRALPDSAVSRGYRAQRTIPCLRKTANPNKLNSAAKSVRVLAAVKRSIALVALLASVASLASCAQPGTHPFLGAPYDGPTAAYGYNYP